MKKHNTCFVFYDQKIRKSIKWFGKQRSIDLDSENAAAVRAHSPTEEVKLIEAENEQNRHAYSVALATAMAAEAAVAATHAAAEVVRLRGAAAKTKEEIAAIKIQTFFRGYLSRRALRALRGLARLKSLIGGQSVKRQVSTTLKCMETMVRLQSEIRFRRIKISEENSVIQGKIQQKRENELEKLSVSMGENWDDSLQSKEKIEANLHNRQEAATRRERALAYAYSHQQTWKNSANQTCMDPNNPRVGWSWLERWMAARPWENGNAIVPEELDTDVFSTKSTTSRSVSVRADAKIRSPTARKHSRPSTPNSKVGGKLRAAPSPRRVSVGTDDDSKSVNSTQSERYRRHSTAGSSVRDDESVASSTSTVRGYMAPTESARAKSRGPSPLGVEKVRMPEKSSSGGSAKKRLSFSGSPAGPRRHSGPPKIDISPVNAIKSNS
ncbi:hypothetical protein BUALT_Bualt01G0108300 [Buddleja alternifolia]|uniref:Protein IQ-DOMAIN 1 n=1 Tax=Buddleja alternifolia TaxID=168488 RepID=A0AAV6YGZ1_9LAMI|nr:hypothetical protein BUALT_Bualt01G0108300 [Buddleja alternifolia]